MPDLSYGYANARIKAMETRLLSAEQYRTIASVSSIPEMTALLQETDYREAMIEASKRHEGASLVLTGLQLDFLATLKKLERILPKKARAAFQVMVGEWDVQDIKTIASKKALGQAVLPNELVAATPESRKRAEKLSAAQTWEEFVTLLSATKYGNAIKEHQTIIRQQKDFRTLATALDDAHARTLLDFSKKAQRKATRELLGERLDLTNRMLVLRLKFIAQKPDITKLLVGPPSAAVKRMLDAQDMAGALLELELPEAALAEYQQHKRLSAIEMALEKRFVDRILKKFRTSVLSFGVVLGFLYLKTAEVTNIKRLALGKVFGVEDQMKHYLYVLG